MGNVSNTTEGMNLVGNEMVNAYNDIDSTMKTLKTELFRLRGQWDGGAAKIFEQTMTDWGVEFDKVLFHLDAMADKLLTGSDHIQKTEDDAIQQGQFFKWPA